VKEEALSFGRGAALRGVLTHPERSAPGPANGRPAVVFLNSGLVHHVGPHRLYVKAARDLARQGFLVLRMDFSGIGDSEKRADNVRFEKAAVEDARAALDHLAERHGSRRFALAGLCSGAEISFKTALVDPRVVGALMINAPQFAEEPSNAVIATVAQGKSAAYYWRVAFFSAESWKRALRGQAEYGSILKAVGNRVARTFGPRGRVRREASADLRAFEALVERGVRLRLLFSEVDWGHEYLNAILGERIEEWKRGANPDLRVLPGVDHMLTPLAAQDRARALIVDWAQGLETAPG
jgi:pimeloyl-ACP methyl ester carboxylesterase